METVETSGRTVQEAVQAAAEELGVAADEIDYEVIEEGSKGFLGLGQIPAVIRAWVRRGAAEAAAAEPGTGAKEIAEVQTEQAAAEAPVAGAETVEQVSEAGASRFSDALMNLLRQVLEAMRVDARAELRSDDRNETWIELTGRDVAILIGRQGQTLDALQYLVGIAAAKASGEKKRLILDAEGYRDKHRRTLERVAREYARQVKAKGQEAELEPQPARDRRIIHLALANDPDVYTYSEGEGENRHVVISPRK